MIRAASSLSAPCQRFLEDAEEQLAHDSVNAAMEGMKIVGAVLQLGAVTAPIGAATSAAASGAAAIESVMWEANKTHQAKKAWAEYKKALEDPESRKKKLQAMRENPTLTKYAMAWAAYMDHDPLAQGFMQACDMNADTLRDPDANLGKVVKYLEAKFPDDVVVVGKDYSQVGKVELTPACWMKALADGRKMGVIDQDTTDLQILLQRWVALSGDLKTENVDVLDGCAEVLAQIKIALLKYVPLDANEVKVGPMLTIRGRFFSAADKAEAEIIPRLIPRLLDKKKPEWDAALDDLEAKGADTAELRKDVKKAKTLMDIKTISKNIAKLQD